MPDSLPLPAQLSAAIVAFTIEGDNEAESRLPHRTTSHGVTGAAGSVWMTSMAMWFNCLRDLADAGPLTVAALQRRARMGTNLDGMRRWGYVTIDGVGRVRRGQPRPRAKAGSVLALTERGRFTADVWRPVPGEIEARWLDRFGAAAVDRLADALRALAGSYERGPLPDFLPIGSMWGVGIGDPEEKGAPDDVSELPLLSLLARVLLAFALDYERGAKLPLGVQLNGVRVLGPDGIPLRQLPRLAGVSSEAIAMIVKRLQSVECVVVEPIPGAQRGKQARLTGERGARAKAAGRRRRERMLEDWRDRHGAGVVDGLADALDPIVGDGSRGGSPLFGGLEPHPDGWRADVPAPERLPWFPMVLHRGGYPDGS